MGVLKLISQTISLLLDERTLKASTSDESVSWQVGVSTVKLVGSVLLSFKKLRKRSGGVRGNELHDIQREN